MMLHMAFSNKHVCTNRVHGFSQKYLLYNLFMDVMSQFYMGSRTVDERFVTMYCFYITSFQTSVEKLPSPCDCEHDKTE